MQGGCLSVLLRCLSFTCHCSGFRLSDCNKENTIRNCVPPKSSLRVDEQQQPSSEGSTKGSTWRADGPHHAFDYVELSPLQQDTQNQGSPPRTRGSLRVSERVSKHEDLERDLAVRSEERRKWFESPDSRVSNSDGLGGTLSRKVEEPDLPAAPLSEEQRVRLNEEIEKKWLELERLPLKDSRRVPLTTLLNQGKGNHGDANEALKKEVRALWKVVFWWPLSTIPAALCLPGGSAEEQAHRCRWHHLHGAVFPGSAFAVSCLQLFPSQQTHHLPALGKRLSISLLSLAQVQSLRAQLESCRARNESLREAAKSQGDGHVPRGYISQVSRMGEPQAGKCQSLDSLPSRYR